MSTRLTYTSGAAAPETDAAFEAALEAARCGPGRAAPARRRRRARRSTAPAFERRDPSRSDAVASRAHEAPAGARRRGGRARAAPRSRSWRRTALGGALRRAARAPARRSRARHMELAAAVTLETGKSRTESIAEVQEAVDLIEAYCEQIERHGGFEVRARAAHARGDQRRASCARSACSA